MKDKKKKKNNISKGIILQLKKKMTSQWSSVFTGWQWVDVNPSLWVDIIGGFMLVDSHLE